MAKPHSRQSLILATHENFEQLEHILTSLSAADRKREFPFKGRDRNVRDVLVQVAAWQKMYLDWSTANLAGEAKRFMPKPYTWQTSGKLSQRIWQQNQATTYAEAHKALTSLHEALMAQFEARTNEELFLKGFYDWTGALSLGEYAAMVGPSHDAWAIKVLKHYRQHLTVASN